jgi:WD40 repeat protein
MTHDLSARLRGGLTAALLITAVMPGFAQDGVSSDPKRGRFEATLRGRSYSSVSTKEGDNVMALAGHTAAVRDVAFFPGGKSLLSAGDDGVVWRWQDFGIGMSWIPTSMPIQQSGAVNAIAVSPDGSRFATGGDGGTIHVWTKEGAPLPLGVNDTQSGELRGHAGAIQALAISEDGLVMVSADTAGEVWFWDTSSWEGARLAKMAGAVSSLALTPDGRLLAAVDAKGNLRFWDLGAGEETRLLPDHPKPATAVAFSPDGRLLAYAQEKTGIILFDMRMKKTTTWRNDPFREARMSRLQFSPNSRLLATVGERAQARLWDVETGVERAILLGHTGPLSSVAFSPNGHKLASAGLDNIVRIYELKTAVTGVLVADRPAPTRSPMPAAPTDDVDSPPPAKTPLDPDSYAVVIGIEGYSRETIPPVEFAARDAQTVHDYLVRAMGFDPQNIILLKGERARKADFDKYIGTWLRNRVTAKSRVLLYYAGHGAPNAETGKPYLVPYDGDPAYIDDTGYPLSRLYANLARLPAHDVRVVLDACFSGQGGRSLIAQGARPLVNVVEETGQVGRNTVVIAATGGKQISTSYPDGQHGLLTHFLLKGLRGMADINQNGRVETAELFRYLEPLVQREALKRNVRQSPTLTPRLEMLGEKATRVWVQLK